MRASRWLSIFVAEKYGPEPREISSFALCKNYRPKSKRPPELGCTLRSVLQASFGASPKCAFQFRANAKPARVKIFFKAGQSLAARSNAEINLAEGLGFQSGWASPTGCRSLTR